MNSSTLQHYLEIYDLLDNRLALSPQQQNILRSLRILASSPNNTLDLSTPVRNLVSSQLTTSAWDTQTAFEKLMNVLGGNADKALFLIQEAATCDTTEWLSNVLQPISTQLGGEIRINRLPSDIYHVNLQGPIAMKYSAFMALISCGLIAKESFLSVQHLIEDVQLLVQEEHIILNMPKTQKLNLIKQSLQSMGFQVDMGSKTCEQSLSQNDVFKARANDLLKTHYGMTLEFADALSATPTQRLVFPMTLKITTYDDELMALLESYYAHPLVNLKSRDGKQKIFIQETRASGLLHESVLNTDQLDTLSHFFDRLSYFSSKLGIPAASIREVDIQLATESIYHNILVDSASLFHMGTSFDISRIETTASSSRLSINQFTTQIEQECKKKLIPMPAAFLNTTPLIQEFNALQAEIFQVVAIDSWPKFKESYRYSVNCSTPRSPIPLKEYAAALANACLRGSKSKIGQTAYQHEQGITWLNQTVHRERYGSAANQYYLDFYTENDAYYLLDSLVNAISDCLNHPNCSDMHIERILNTLGVSSSNISSLKHEIDGKTYFNRFQVKLFLLPMTLHALSQKGILGDLTILSTERHPWVTVVHHPSMRTLYSSTAEDWCRGMATWKNNEIDGISWSTGGPAATTEYRKTISNPLSSQSIYAGSSQSDQKRVEERKNTISYGGSG